MFCIKKSSFNIMSQNYISLYKNLSKNSNLGFTFDKRHINIDEIICK